MFGVLKKKKSEILWDILSMAISMNFVIFNTGWYFRVTRTPLACQCHYIFCLHVIYAWRAIFQVTIAGNPDIVSANVTCDIGCGNNCISNGCSDECSLQCPCKRECWQWGSLQMLWGVSHYVLKNVQTSMSIDDGNIGNVIEGLGFNVHMGISINMQIGGRVLAWSNFFLQITSFAMCKFWLCTKYSYMHY